MSEKKAQFRTVTGFIQFDPREGQAGGKDVRNITIRQVGFREQAVLVSATLWPSHEHVAVEKGDLVTIDGSYKANQQTKEDGSKVVYHNISVGRIFVHGKGDAGVKVDDGAANETAESEQTDDIPF